MSIIVICQKTVKRIFRVTLLALRNLFARIGLLIDLPRSIKNHHPELLFFFLPNRLFKFAAYKFVSCIELKNLFDISKYLLTIKYILNCGLCSIECNLHYKISLLRYKILVSLRCSKFLCSVHKDSLITLLKLYHLK